MNGRRLAVALLASLVFAAARAGASDLITGERLPTGQSITPTAAPGAVFQTLDPEIAEVPGYLADHATSVATSPDGRTLLVLTSGYNRVNGPTGSRLAAASNEYVFVYDATRDPPEKKQVIQVPNTFAGIAWSPHGRAFHVSGGVDDVVRTYAESGGVFTEVSPPIPLGHAAGLGLQVRPMAAGLAVNASGTKAVVANFENDSVSVVDLAARTVVAEVDLRPGKADPAKVGVPGGEFPFWVAIRGDDTAYVSSQRDDEVVVVDLASARVSVRIPVGVQPGKMILDRAGERLFVANGSADTVSVIDTVAGRVVAEIPVAGPRGLLRNVSDLKGANPNALALSPDERTLYVTLGGLNAVSVVALSEGEEGDEAADRCVALLPTGWYPSDLALDAGGGRLFVVNGKSNAGPNPKACRSTLSIAPGSSVACSAANQYVWQLEKAGLLSFPVPGPHEMARLSRQVAANNRFTGSERGSRGREVMAFVRSRVKHVIYVIKENRTYDQVLGDLDRGNGDPSLAIFGAATSPNHQALARTFVTLDNFFDSGETSGVGWNWTTAARTTDFTEKTQPVNYAGRGLSYDWEGTNRNVNVGFATVAERQAAMAYTPSDPDLLPGTSDVAAPRYGDGSDAYLWTAALRAGLTVRNYGCFGDLTRYFLPQSDPNFIPLERDAHAAGVVQFIPSKPELMAVSAPYFRGYDMKYPDYWRYKDWEREFDGYAERGNLPSLSLVRLPRDHFGDYATSIDGTNTPAIQMADNDYAVGLLIEKVSKSRFADDTLVFIVEDDAQNGGDHVDAHRSIAYVVGPYVKRGAVVPAPYDTVSMVRTIEDVLGLEPMGLTDALAEPMWEVFEKQLRPWRYEAIVPDPLRESTLPLPVAAATPPAKDAPTEVPGRDAAWWASAMAGQDFTREDALDTDRFNRVLWAGMKGEGIPYPEVRHGRDLSLEFGRTLRTEASSGR
jgi:YVTN family beta-propeller protein